MDCVPKCYVDGKWFIVQCKTKDERLLIYKSRKDGKGIRLSCPFVKLWFLPWELQTSAYIPGIPDRRAFTLPSSSLTVLSAQTSPGDYLPLFWSADSLVGPITSQGVELNTMFTGIDYKVTWQSSKWVKIGFYTQMAFLGTDIYPLVDNDYVLQICEGKEGSFVMGNYERFYVAASSSKEAIITLSVEVSIPDACPASAEKLRIECCNYRVYKQKVDNFVVVNSFLNPQLNEIYSLILDTFISNSLSAPISSVSLTHASKLASPPILSFYTMVLPDLRIGGIFPDTNNESRTRAVAYTNTSNFVPPEYPTNIFPAASGSIDKVTYLGVTLGGIPLPPGVTSIDIYYDITINNLLVPRLKRTEIICVVAQYFDGVNNEPVNVIVNQQIIGNDELWMTNIQNPPAISRITNSNPLNRRPLTVPVSFGNVVLSVRPGVTSAPQPFEVAYGIVSNNMFDGFINFTSVIAVPSS